MKREKNNIANIVFCLLALLPILLVLLHYDSSTSLYSNLSTMNSSLSSLTKIPFMAQIKQIVLGIFGNPADDYYLSLAIDYFSWLFVLSVVDLCYYGLLFFFRIIKDLIDKLGGNI